MFSPLWTADPQPHSCQSNAQRSARDCQSDAGLSRRAQRLPLRPPWGHSRAEHGTAEGRDWRARDRWCGG